MKAKKSSTLHRCTEFTKWPSDEMCHHGGAPEGETTRRTPRTTTKRGEGQHPEHVDPGRDVRRLPVGQHLALGDGAAQPVPEGGRPGTPVGGRHGGSCVTVVGGSLVVVRERDHQRQDEHHDHREDHEEVGDTDAHDSP